jgi:type 1 glutamine amidotransferase
MGDFHPIAWYQHYDGGRAFYSGLGHLPETYEQSMFLSHIYGGIYWAATGKGMPSN